MWFAVTRMRWFLYLARVNGRWLHVHDAASAALKNGHVPAQIERWMREESVLDDFTELGDLDMEFRAKEKRRACAGVVARACPCGEVNIASENAGLSIAVLDAATLEAFGAVIKRGHGPRDARAATQEIAVEVERCRAPRKSPTRLFRGFHWDMALAENEPSQRAAYMAYLTQHLAALVDGGGFSLINIAEDEDVLSCIATRLPCRVTGTADALLLHRRSPDPIKVLAGVSVVINVNKTVDESHVPQALYRLTCCSIMAPMDCYPVGLLTDLNSTWNVTWFDQDATLTSVILYHPQNAITFLKALVRAQPGPTPFRLPFISGNFHKLIVDDFCSPQSDDYVE